MQAHRSEAIFSRLFHDRDTLLGSLLTGFHDHPPLRQAPLVGLYVIVAHATAQPAHGGYQPDELIALLKYRVLPAIDFLFEHNAYPALYRVREAGSATEELPAAATQGTTSTQIAAEAADDLGDLGTGFME
jgi:hypothetical protein